MEQSIPQIIGYIFHPSHMIVNTLILGNMKVAGTKTEGIWYDENGNKLLGPKEYLAAYGLG